MVQLTRIYTKSGDKGKTALGNGTRVPKNSVRVDAYGTVDETNAVIGVARLHAQGEVDEMLARIQNDLFDLGADLCTPGDGSDDNPEQPALRITAKQTERLETEIDQINASLDPLKSFVLPGGSALAAQLHVARTVSRRAERLIVELAGVETINPEAMRYVNRLSDHMFVLARHANNDGKEDVLWQPGLTR
ncbi:MULTISPECIES: cob(I)yrinic acid a,c-diamide adenosyltransferase [unclassified Thalassospira]|mgnify:CR=1|uniref:cob(I)yrinic acid a,c-diamide adenosyltransferase n=1 Tax=unclassified Thalassospira TaxID=2648997 RepID=UPI000C3EE22C|nr:MULTISPECIES: cob(I)yrinic acid a,c-diamide adenosyltransferase [unclassified Thalassospira]MBC45102.1 ATP:cob(I)alamin adenosyltransferase [Thalassospira sp.]HAI29354.1 cob(I)yrinic acid a,c-diamide adenosyltransferase [Thalassospira sp.]|tara:strand:- start:3207 stop:3779 length:573 start_codon:yes stop_codon:yes gene_type:complete